MESELQGVVDERARLTEAEGGAPGGAREARSGPLAISVTVVVVALFGYLVYLCAQPQVTLFSFHPLCMAIGWLLLMTSGINAFSPGDIALQWMPVKNNTRRHWVLQTTALTFILSGFVVIETNKFLMSKYHFTTPHGIVGLISVILVLLTSSGGLFTLYSMKFKKLIAPIYVKLIHSGIGLVTYTMGLITITLAMFSHWWNGNEILRIIFIILLFFVLFWSVIRPLVKWYARLRERINYIRETN